MIGLQKISDRPDEHRVQAWIHVRLAPETNFYFNTAVDGFTLLGDGEDIARLEKIKKAASNLTESQQDVLEALSETFSVEALPVTSEQLCNHLGGIYIKKDGSPYLQSMNYRLKSLLDKGLVLKKSSSTPTEKITYWTPAQLPPDQQYMKKRS